LASKVKESKYYRVKYSIIKFFNKFFKVKMRSKWSFYRIMVVGSGNGLPSRVSLAGVRARTVAVGLKKSPNFKGSSGESWTMN
jgi:hypothetical protein